MSANYLKITARRLLRQKAFSLINILGLSIGLAACLLIYLYVYSETTFDAYNPKADRIARVTAILHSPESDLAFATTQPALAPALVSDLPEVEATVRIEDTLVAIRQGTEVLAAKNFFYSEPSIFRLFEWKFLEGDAAHALSSPQSIVLTRSMEKKFFGEKPALGQSLVCNGQLWRVTAVVEDRPGNTDLEINGLLSRDYKATAWVLDDFRVYTFVLFRQKPDIGRFNKALAAMDKYTVPLLKEQGAQGWTLRFEAEALKNVHFSGTKYNDTIKGNRSFNKIFSALAVFILLIALLNYINLSTARAAERMKEVGVRKVIGARPAQLIRQFLSESALLVALAWIIAIGLVLVGISLFNKALETRLSFNGWAAFVFPVLLFPVTVLLAGGYPAFMLSSYRPVKVLKGGGGVQKGGGAGLRRLFTVIQFTIAIAMLSGAIIFYQQMYFMMHRDPGLDRSQILEVPIPIDSVSRAAAPAFVQALRGESGIHGVSVGSGLPSDGLSASNTTIWSNNKKREMLVLYFFFDPTLIPMLHIRLVAGRNFSDSFPTDKSEAFIVNEAFVRSVGWSSPIGQRIETGDRQGKVIGVVGDFFYKSMHNIIEPMVMIYKTDPPWAVVVKTSESEVARVKEIWKQFYPAIPFDFDFLDKDYNDQYRKDRVTLFLFNILTGLTIFISCLGLYGLVSLTTVQRAKEIAIRKVLGARVSRLMLLLSAGQLWLIAWAALIALPLAALGARKWLATYAYHTQPNPWMFVLPVLILLLLTLAITGYRVLRPALANPAKSLRSE